MGKVIFVSAGMLKNKKSHQETSLYLNYGFLGLASIVSDCKSVDYYQGDIYLPEELFKLFTVKKVFSDTYPLFLSIPSYYAVSWAENFSKLVKINYPSKIIICGGRWVVKDKTFLKNNLRYIDYFVNGQAENIILDLLYKKSLLIENKYIENNVFNQNIPKLNYKILNNYLEYTTAIELSRGCGMGCVFCEDKNVKLTTMKEPSILIEEIIELKNLYNDEYLKFYFQSSFFNPTIKWIKKFHNLFLKNNLTIQWRCETRVDSLTVDKILLLANSGLKIIDLGLESASIKQLKLMHKTGSPNKYLNLASKLLNACYENNIWVKINILLYPGETMETVNETLQWLRKHKRYIKGISAYSLIIFGVDNHALNFLKEVEKLGAKSITEGLDASGITKLNLSSEISYEMSMQVSLNISREFMSKNDYFDLKSFGYFRRSYTHSDFLKDIENIDKNELPFNI